MKGLLLLPSFSLHISLLLNSPIKLLGMGGIVKCKYPSLGKKEILLENVSLTQFNFISINSVKSCDNLWICLLCSLK